jgi:hypothetical protein
LHAFPGFALLCTNNNPHSWPRRCTDLGAGKMLEQLIEEGCDLYDWIALLWAAFGETPGKE